jgi:hypothetical protein
VRGRGAETRGTWSTPAPSPRFLLPVVRRATKERLWMWASGHSAAFGGRAGTVSVGRPRQDLHWRASCLGIGSMSSRTLLVREGKAIMPMYPLELYRRAEEKWKRRAGALRTKAGLPPNKEGDGVLIQWPWLLAIGQELQSEYAAPRTLPKRLAALLKKLMPRR